MVLLGKDNGNRLILKTFGASFPVFRGELSAPLGRAAGTWTVRVDELVTGRSADVTVAVKAPAGLPFAQSLVAVPTADVQRENLVREFIEGQRTMIPSI